MREAGYYSSHIWLISTVVFSTYSQAMVRWRLSAHGDMPDQIIEKIKFIFFFLLDAYVLSAVFATFLAGVCWIVSLSKFELNYAYPWMSLIFLFTLLSGHFALGESLTLGKVAGTLFIIIGLFLIVRA